MVNRIGSETSQKIPNENASQKPFQLARVLFILMDSAVICIYFRNTQPPISLKINAAFVIRNTLVIILTNLLKQDLTFSSNAFYGPFNADFAGAKSPLVIIFSSSSGNSSSCRRSGGGSSSGSDSTSSCVSSSKILPWTGKYKLGAIAGVRVGKYNLGTSAGKCKVSVRVGKHKLGARTL